MMNNLTDLVFSQVSTDPAATVERLNPDALSKPVQVRSLWTHLQLWIDNGTG